MRIKLYFRTIEILVLKIIKKERIMMAKIYFNRLLIGTITYDAVPARYQSAVIEYGRQYVTDGKMSVEEFEMIFKEPFEG